MFDKNLEDFVKSVGLSKVSEIVLNCPEGFGKYLKSTGTYIKRSKKLCYNSDEIDVDDLGYISYCLFWVWCKCSCLVIRSCLDKFTSDIFNTTYRCLYAYRDWETDRKSTRLNSSHITRSRMPSSA